MPEEFNPACPILQFDKFKYECANAVVKFHIHMHDTLDAMGVVVSPGMEFQMSLDARLYAEFLYYSQQAEELSEAQQLEIEQEVDEQFALRHTLMEMGYFSPEEIPPSD